MHPSGLRRGSGSAWAAMERILGPWPRRKKAWGLVTYLVIHGTPLPSLCCCYSLWQDSANTGFAEKRTNFFQTVESEKSTGKLEKNNGSLI
jgi:hypothetical protein